MPSSSLADNARLRPPSSSSLLVVLPPPPPPGSDRAPPAGDGYLRNCYAYPDLTFPVLQTKVIV
ncbi:Uncharacterized protein PODLI_1B029992 [Podarcis lilfordi]|uniref:Uncharacterized protein n=1 Tax=Podarcis lilfordi TaxID=74358 RepID=A0AA35PB58_9SAUR|nr:Uncharacterized protein PODLI_1B029992 [Podarcis lilfordi]